MTRLFFIRYEENTIQVPISRDLTIWEFKCLLISELKKKGINTGQLNPAAFKLIFCGDEVDDTVKFSPSNYGNGTIIHALRIERVEYVDLSDDQKMPVDELLYLLWRDIRDPGKDIKPLIQHLIKHIGHEKIFNYFAKLGAGKVLEKLISLANENSHVLFSNYTAESYPPVDYVLKYALLGSPDRRYKEQCPAHLMFDSESYQESAKRLLSELVANNPALILFNGEKSRCCLLTRLLSPGEYEQSKRTDLIRSILEYYDSNSEYYLNSLSVALRWELASKLVDKKICSFEKIISHEYLSNNIDILYERKDQMQALNIDKLFQQVDLHPDYLNLLIFLSSGESLAQLNAAENQSNQYASLLSRAIRNHWNESAILKLIELADENQLRPGRPHPDILHFASREHLTDKIKQALSEKIQEKCPDLLKQRSQILSDEERTQRPEAMQTRENFQKAVSTVRSEVDDRRQLALNLLDSAPASTSVENVSTDGFASMDSSSTSTSEEDNQITAFQVDENRRIHFNIVFDPKISGIEPMPIFFSMADDANFVHRFKRNIAKEIIQQLSAQSDNPQVKALIHNLKEYPLSTLKLFFGETEIRDEVILNKDNYCPGMNVFIEAIHENEEILEGKEKFKNALNLFLSTLNYREDDDSLGENLRVFLQAGNIVDLVDLFRILASAGAAQTMRKLFRYCIQHNMVIELEVKDLALMKDLLLPDRTNKYVYIAPEDLESMPNADLNDFFTLMLQACPMLIRDETVEVFLTNQIGYGDFSKATPIYGNLLDALTQYKLSSHQALQPDTDRPDRRDTILSVEKEPLIKSGSHKESNNITPNFFRRHPLATGVVSGGMTCLFAGASILSAAIFFLGIPLTTGLIMPVALILAASLLIGAAIGGMIGAGVDYYEQQTVRYH